ncbi:MAG: hypothetical protein V4598_16870 [Bdellovibrionota bacterium]
MKFIILFLLISFGVMADNDCVNCAANLRAETHAHNLEEFSKRLEHWSANSSQVMNAPCKHKTFDTEKMNQELVSLIGKKDKKILGVKFKDENPELLRVFKNLTVKNKMSWFEKLFYKTEPEVNLQGVHAINPECDKVLCAVDKIWGQFVGRKMLFMNMKYGYNSSNITNKNAAPFSEPEIDDVLMAMEDLPKSIMPMVRDRKLIKYLPDAEHPDKGPKVWADSRIVLFAPWFAGEQGLRFQTLAHEVGHVMHYALPSQKSNEFNAMSSWVKVGDKWEFDTIGACMPSKYAMTSPMEDFAETASAYRYNGRALLAQCPAKYAFLKDTVFQGVEYRDESQCAGK